MQNRSPEKPSKVDAPGTRFGTQNRWKSTAQGQQTAKIDKKQYVFGRGDFQAIFYMRKNTKNAET